MTSLEESIQLKLGRCQESLKENIGTCTKYGKFLGTILAISALSSFGIWVSLGIDKSIDWIIGNSSFSNTTKFLYILRFVACFVFVSVLSVFCFYHFVIRKQYEKSLCDIKTNSIDSEKDGIEKFFEEFKVSAKGTEAFFRNKISLFGDMNNEVNFKREWYLKCEKMKMVITFFGLDYLEETILDLGKNPPDNSINPYDETTKKNIIDYVCDEAPYDLTLMNLLVSYYDGKSNDVESRWKIVKNDEKLLDQIASIVWKLNIFNLYEDIAEVDEYILNVGDLKLILSKTQLFEKYLITNNVLLYIRIYNFLLNYHEILSKESERFSKEKINLKKQLTKKEIIDNIDFYQDFESNFIKIFSKELRESLDIDSKDAYVDALMAIIMSPDINFRDKICKKVSKNDEAIYVLTAYYDLREKKGASNEQFLLFDIIDDEKTATIKEKIKDNRKYEILFEHVRSALSNGEWCESSQTIIQSKVEEILDKLDKNERNEKLVKIFAKYFTKIKLRAATPP